MRFKAKSYEKYDENGIHIALSPEYLNKRFELFDAFCFPSIKDQVNSNFFWLVFFDKDTPEEYKERISSSPYKDVFIPIYVENDDDLVPSVNSYIKNVLNAPEWVITTRIDNDDSFHEKAIDIIQDGFKMDANERFINLNNGIAIDDTKKSAYEVSYPGNPFISRIEKNTGAIKTVFSCMHHDIYKLYQVQDVVSAPAWLQIIHGGNVANTIPYNTYPLGPKIAEEKMKEFHIQGIEFSHIQYILTTTKVVGQKIIRRLKYMISK